MNTYVVKLCRTPILLFFLILPMPVSSQPIQTVDIQSTMNPVGSGARAIGMGGAFIAVADDATAASWNPGGLTQLERPEISIVGSYFNRIEDNDFGTNPEASVTQQVDGGNLNYLSMAYPFTLLHRNMIISLNYQYLYDFTREWNFSLKQQSTNYLAEQNIDYKQQGGLSAIGLAYGLQVTKRISIGVTLNIWERLFGDNGWKEETNRTISGNHEGDSFIFQSNNTEEHFFSGINFNLGFLWHLTNNFSIGGVFKSPFQADLQVDSEYYSTIDFPDQPQANNEVQDNRSVDNKLDMPMSYGLGMAYRFSDTLSVSLDFYRTEWDDYVLTDSDGNEISPITGQSLSETDIKPTNQVRLGTEYLFVNQTYIIPIRGGIFYDPVPAEGKPDNFYGLSLGSGIVWNSLVFDLAYQYRFGNDVGSHSIEELEFSQDVKEHSIYTSIIVHF